MTTTDTHPIGRTIFEAIALASVCADKDRTSAVLAGVLIEPLADKPHLLRAVATNGKVLAVVHADGGPNINPPKPGIVHPESIRRAREFHRRMPRHSGRLPYSATITATWTERRVLFTDSKSDDACMLRLCEGTYPAYRSAFEDLSAETLTPGFMPNTGIDWRYLQLVETVLGRGHYHPRHTKRANVFRSDLDYILVMPICLPALTEPAAA